jgi:plasmid maintenance system antidote protein VapI
MNLQSRYDLAIVEQNIGEKINIEIEQAAHSN